MKYEIPKARRDVDECALAGSLDNDGVTVVFVSTLHEPSTCRCAITPAHVSSAFILFKDIEYVKMTPKKCELTHTVCRLIGVQARIDHLAH